MKNKFLILLFGLLFSLSSCEDYFGDVNVNPNSPTTVPPSTILPVIESILNYSVWGDLSRFSSIITGQVDGVDRQFASYNEYIIRGNDLDAFWNNMYSNALTDIGQLRIVAGSPSENSAYHGIANILEAYTILTITDYFGDVPFSEAVNKNLDGNIQPKYDSQESIYIAAIALLNESLTLLDGTNLLTPGADDLIYKGDLTKWKKFANAILARAYLHLGERDITNYQRAFDAASASFTSHADNPQFSYEESKASPWNQFLNQRAGSFEPGSFYVSLMESLNDPRISKFGATLDAAHPILTPTAGLPFISYTEIQFILAECAFRLNLADAESNYINAITSSFTQYGYSDSLLTEYLAQATVNDLSLQNIITQKYIANFMSPENFSDWRRTGFPELSPKSGSQIPRRLPYPQTETDYNFNTPKPTDVNIFDRVWWDVN